ncbi:MAG: Na+:solute symporter [Deltaproteobacteria bacterium]|jgi:solute:Na+ symporter, SSS family|nr:Na+:solute symporter [Deltaproteobacteria bacterium]
MRTLAPIDYWIIAIYGVVCIVLGTYYTKKASKNVDQFFLTGRSMPWWLIGASMAATNFSIDTPLAITKYVFSEGIGGCWFFWSSAISGMLATFFFAKMWRKAQVMTDAEIVERRYSGKSAAILRVFKGCYFGIFINCFVMGWVFLAVFKVLTGLTNFDPFWIVLGSAAAVAVYTLSSGLYGVILTDFIQYGFALFGSFALMYYSVKGVGGMDTVIGELTKLFGENSAATSFLPSFSSQAGQAFKGVSISSFFVYIMVQWWSQKYSDGGGKHIQRMSAAKNPKHATLATFFFTIMNYAVQMWPWVIVALCAIVLYGRDVPDPEMTYVWMMGRWLPHGILGIMMVSLIAAFMSTISTHLNLGGSYVINDIYRRFFVRNASEKHYVLMSRIAMLVGLGISIIISMNMESVGGAWKFIIAFASGAGVTWVLRWFWWRINAWTEISAMIASAIIALYLKFNYPELDYGYRILTIMSLSAVVWITVTFLTSPVDEKRLVAFVEQVEPGSPGWNYIYKKYGIQSGGFSGRALFNMIIGVVFFFSLNFGLGGIFLHRYVLATVLLSSAVASMAFLLYRINMESKMKSVESHAKKQPKGVHYVVENP